MGLARRAEQRRATGVLEHDPVTVLNAWLGGTVGMMFWWPPPGRWSAGLVAGQEGFDFVAESTVADKVGYAVMPQGHGAHASGFHVAVGADSPNQGGRLPRRSMDHESEGSHSIA